MKKAFTLIELLGVIILLAIVALVVYPIVDNVIQKSKEETYVRSVENIEKAARAYGTINNLGYETKQKTLSIETLITAGLIKGENLKNPKTGNNFEGCILYSWDSNASQYKYEYSEECIVGTDIDCFEYEEEIESLESYDVDLLKCVDLSMQMFDFDSNAANSICNGGEYMGATLHDILSHDIFTFETFSSYNAISNVVVVKGITITDYLCGGSYNYDTETFTDGTEMNPIIPKKINNQNVKKIDTESFMGKGIYSIEIPDSITEIGNAAFAYNRISTLVIPNNVTKIGHGAFFENKITNLTLSPNLTVIGEDAFNNNQLKSLDLSKLTNLDEIFENSFCNNSNITNETFVGIGEYTYNYFRFDCPQQ